MTSDLLARVYLGAGVAFFATTAATLASKRGAVDFEDAVQILVWTLIWPFFLVYKTCALPGIIANRRRGRLIRKRDERERILRLPVEQLVADQDEVDVDVDDMSDAMLDAAIRARRRAEAELEIRRLNAQFAFNHKTREMHKLLHRKGE